jgi:hypothetical protein
MLIGYATTGRSLGEWRPKMGTHSTYSGDDHGVARQGLRMFQWSASE